MIKVINMVEPTKTAADSGIKPQAPALEDKKEESGLGETLKNMGKFVGNSLLNNLSNNLNEADPSKDKDANNASKNKDENPLQSLGDELAELVVNNVNNSLTDAIIGQASKVLDKAIHAFNDKESNDKTSEKVDPDLNQIDTKSMNEDEPASSSSQSMVPSAPLTKFPDTDTISSPEQLKEQLDVTTHSTPTPTPSISINGAEEKETKEDSNTLKV